MKPARLRPKSATNTSANYAVRAVIRALIGVAVLLPAASGADPTGRKEPETRALAVSVADLDLKTAEGARIARERISAAARKLCQRLENDRKVDYRETTRDCYRDAVATAWQQAAAPERVAETQGPTGSEPTPKQ